MEMIVFEPWLNNAIQSIENKTPELRDSFAMAALIGITSANQMARPEYQSQLAYEYADAMMKARKEK